MKTIFPYYPGSSVLWIACDFCTHTQFSGPQSINWLCQTVYVWIQSFPSPGWNLRTRISLWVRSTQPGLREFLLFPLLNCFFSQKYLINSSIPCPAPYSSPYTSEASDVGVDRHSVVRPLVLFMSLLHGRMFHLSPLLSDYKTSETKMLKVFGKKERESKAKLRFLKLPKKSWPVTSEARSPSRAHWNNAEITFIFWSSCWVCRGTSRKILEAWNLYIFYFRLHKWPNDRSLQLCPTEDHPWIKAYIPKGEMTFYSLIWTFLWKNLNPQN